MMKQKDMGKRIRHLILLVLAFMTIFAGSAWAAQARLAYNMSPNGAGTFKVYINKRGQKTYLSDQGGYFNIDIPDGSSLGMTVWFEVQPSSSCNILQSISSNDMQMYVDQNGVRYVKFTKAKDAGQTRHATASFLSNHSLKTIPAVQPTCTKKGNKQYYQCTKCGKYFQDSGATQPTTPKQMIVKALGHKWDNGVITRKPTTKQTGIKTFTCQRCGAKKTETIPKLYVDPKGDGVCTPDTPISFSTIEKKLQKKSYRGALKCSDFGILFLRAYQDGKSQIKLTWKKVPTAKKYVVYMASKGKKFKKMTTFSGRKYRAKNLKAGTYYSFVVVAINDDKAVAVSVPIIASTAGRANVKDVEPSTTSINLGVGHAANLDAKFETSDAPGKNTFQLQRGIRYESENVDVAKVDSKGGVVTGVGSGSCTIHVYAQNGLYKDVVVNVY